MDIWGPFTPSFGLGPLFFLTIIDDLKRHTWTFFMKHKSETRPLILQFINLVQTQYNKTIKKIRSDNGKEFLMEMFFKDKGIIHQKTCIKIQQQKDVAERKHRHILNVARVITLQSNPPKLFWIFFTNHAVYLINRLPSHVITSQSPHELFVQGCQKFDSLTTKCVFLGFRQGIKGYIVMNIITREIFISKDVQFYENSFPSITPPITFTPHP